MKQRKIVSMIGALVVIIGAGALITGCQQANSNNGGNTGSNTGNGGSSTTTEERAVYVAKIEHSGVTYTNTITFKTDGTWMQRTVGKGRDAVVQQGTYTGDPSKDGTITITVTKVLNGTALVDVKDPKPMDITIKDGKCTVMGTEYTRQ